MKRILVMVLKVGLSAAIIGYLVYDATQTTSEEHGNVFSNLVRQSKRWDMLATAWVCCAAAVGLTFLRWWRLVCALGVDLRFRDSIRISFWGYLFNLAPLGIVGGDLVKAVMLGHEHPQHRAKALASVLVDRVIGLYVLFVVVSAAIFLTGFWWRVADQPDIRWICKLTFLITAASTVGLIVVMGPDVTDGRVIRAFGRIPRVGPPLESLINAVRMYNRKPGTLALSCLMTVGVHCLFALGCFCIACGLPGNHLSVADHFVVVPLSSATGILPLPMGPFEAVLDYFYVNVSAPPLNVVAGQGLLVALVYRLITLLIASCGVYYYLGNRRELREVMHEAETER